MRCFARFPLPLIAAVLLAPAPASSQTADSSETVRSLLAFEDARFAAMVRRDTAWLRDALADDLSYVHSSAKSDTKATYLESVGSGALKYQGFAPKERRVRLLGAGTAVVVGLAHARAVSDGQPIDVDVRYTGVYERVRGRWRLVAWQTTRFP